ncbi:MAG: hypothetical protein ACKOEO_04345 [Planctomycetaceae bacterium]
MNRYVKSAVVFMAFLLTAGWWRLNQGVHFSEVYVRIPDAVDSANVQVFAQQQTGKVLLLPAQPVDERLRAYGNAAGVKWLWITGATPDMVRTFSVKAGSGWLEAEALDVAEVRSVLRGDAGDLKIPEALAVDSAVQLRTERRAWSSGWLASDAMNWGGDGWFVAVVFLQATWCVLTVWVLWAMVRSFAYGGGTTAGQIAGRWSGLQGLLLQLPRMVFLLLLLHQAWWSLCELSLLRGPGEYVAGSVVFGLLLLVYLGWTRVVERTATRRGLILQMLAVGSLLMGLKVVWIFTVDYQASSDYAKYEKLGRWLAAGDWDSIRGMSKDLLAPIYLSRAWGYTHPVCLLFGPGRTALELSNCFVQGISVLVMCVLICRVMDLKTAARFLPLAFLYPEFWYAAGMVSHNVPGYFWIPVCWLVTDMFDSGCLRKGSSGWWWLLGSFCCTVLAGAILGISLGFLNLAKSYGALFFAGLLIFMVFRRWFAQPGSVDGTGVPRLSERLVFTTAAIGVYVISTGTVQTYLQDQSKYPRLDYGTLAAISGMDMTSPDPGKSANIWRVQFMESCPAHLRQALIYRRLVHEYVANGHVVYLSVLRKNRHMGRPVEAMVHVADELTRGEVLHSSRFMKLPVFQKTLAWQFALWLVLAGVSRLLAIGGAPARTGEIFPWLTAGVTLIVAYVLTDGISYSGLNYAYPLCWTAAMLVPRLGGHRWQADGQVLNGWRTAIQPTRLFAGVGLCGLLVGAHILLGDAVDKSGLTFHSLVELPSGESDGVPTVGDVSRRVGETFVTRLHAGVRLNPADHQLRAGDTITGRFRVSAARGPLQGVRFFVTSNSRYYQTGNQRSREDALARSWKGVPIEYVLLVQGKELHRGPLDQVRGTRHAELPVEYWREGQADAETPADSVDFTLRLECKGDVNTRNMSWPPSLAVEFFR